MLPPTSEPSKSAPLAYENQDFLSSPDGRSLRILAEYQEPMTRFRRERIEDTVVFFGSARIRSLVETTAALEQLSTAGGTDEELEHARKARDMSAFYEDARSLARTLALWARSLGGPRHRFVVTSGGGPGIMEAANRGAFEAGCRTIGLNIRLPFEQHFNPYLTPELNFEFHYFFMRKFWFAYLAKALVIFPGGFGTMDEMFELLTLAQTEKLATPITVIIYGSNYWKGILNLEMMVERGVIAGRDVDLFRFADTPEEAFAILKAGLSEHHLSSEGDGESGSQTVPEGPAPCAEEMLGPDIAHTRS